jgi:hypothetical protein
MRCCALSFLSPTFLALAALLAVGACSEESRGAVGGSGGAGGSAGVRDSGLVPGDPNVLALTSGLSVENGRFSTSDACAACHDNAPNATAMRDEDDRAIAPYDLWQSSMMANAARDPLWRAVVSAEIAATPRAAEAIEQKCNTCHSPMAGTDARLLDQPLPGMEVLVDGTERMGLALDGVSCTLCHQIESNDLGTEASFSGGYDIAALGQAYGPHANPSAMPMERMSGFSPVQADHMLDSSLCATCHTLSTDALSPEGEPTGGHVVEQGPYLEWEISDFAFNTSCQDCHLPQTSEDGVPISTKIAHNPSGGDFPALEVRSPFGRHLLVGGNTLIPAILRDWADLLNPLAAESAFDATIAAAREQLAENTARLTLTELDLIGNALSFTAGIEVLTGHKFPTGIPLRRAWLHTTVTDARGAVLFESGNWDQSGRLVDQRGAVLPSEELAGPLLPHIDRVRSPASVPVYQGVLADSDGAPTFLLMRGEGWVKDNRLLPAGFDRRAAAAAGIAPVGVDDDPNFVGGADTVSYEIDAPDALPPLTVEVELLYQPLSARWAAELFGSGTAEALAFQVMYESADRSPELIDRASAVVH